MSHKKVLVTRNSSCSPPVNFLSHTAAHVDLRLISYGVIGTISQRPITTRGESIALCVQIF